MLGAIASYVDIYYTESIGQWVANDLRVRVYHHLERLSFAYYDTHRTGALLSIITDDIATIQGFASSTTLGTPEPSGELPTSGVMALDWLGKS